ncbi:MAG: sugar transferase [Desulfuromusa sp.]|nr:sugar transferase [Desulfuromusa sp.]
MKRVVDIIFSLLGLMVASPILLIFIVAVWLQDFKSPFYIAPRAGKKMQIFHMVKLRSMVVNADKSGVDSTSADDMRITSVGNLIRKFKIDELSQLWNVLKGDMSFVGPRPNVEREVDLYTSEERHLLDIRPGITDFSSIVFSDEGEILGGAKDPDLLYNQIIRPWKSRLGLFYVQHHNLILDIKLILLTVIAIVSRQQALNGVVKILEDLGADERLVAVAKRNTELQPFPPPGAETIMASRSI